MLIRRMAASFGKLQNHTLEFNKGLNIIQAPNETGKSTWCAFLTAMFYGINSRERDKAGFIAEKNRYAPWSGTAMAGRIDCRQGDDELTIMRDTRRQTSPMGEFKAIYAGTGDVVPGLTSQNCGETLLGVSREVFERSAFIRQSSLTITQDAGLERRIAALITSGEEDTSYTEAAALLKKQLNRRRHNKTGQLPQLELRLDEARRQLAELRTLEAQLNRSSQEIQALQQQEATLSQELALHDRWATYQKQQELAEAEAEAAAATQHCDQLRAQLTADQIPESETISRLRGAIVNLETVRKSVDKARAERDEAIKILLHAESALQESPFAGQSPDAARRSAAAIPAIRPKQWWLPPLLAIASAAIAFFVIGPLVLWLTIAGAAGLAIGLTIMFARSSSDHKKHNAYLAAFKASSPEHVDQLLDTYLNMCAARDAAQAEADRRSATADALYSTLSSNEQGILLEVRRFAPTAYNIPTADALLRNCAQRRQELVRAEAAARESSLRCSILRRQPPDTTADSLPPIHPSGSREEVAHQAEQTRFALTAARSAADRLSGRLHAIGNSAALESSIAADEQEYAQLDAEYRAIQLAIETLDDANTTLQNRFSPALGRRAAEIFSQLTEGRYSGVVLDRSFHLSTEPANDTVYRDAQLLSSGAADQLYLAVRLAICDLVLDSETAVPIILDDALSNFDDERCAAALRWLKEESKHRQIILFTCHSREANFFAGDSEVSIQRLTNHPQVV